MITLQSLFMWNPRGGGGMEGLSGISSSGGPIHVFTSSNYVGGIQYHKTHANYCWNQA